jgi:hypothetical protein
MIAGPVAISVAWAVSDGPLNGQAFAEPVFFGLRQVVEL